MDGFFNSSEFEALEEEFGLEFFSSAHPSETDEFCLENFVDSPVLEETLLGIFNEDPSLFLGMEEGPEPVRREGTPKIDYWETKWGKMFLDPNVGKPGTKAAKNFRRRWRLPKVVMDHIIERCREVNLFDISHPHLVRVPLEFKVLMAIRVLARGNCADDIAELSDGHESTVNSVFKYFVRKFVYYFYDEYVKIPTGADLEKTMDAYKEVGSPGAMGSMNATHLGWDKCPEALKHLCTGKEKFPTLAFNCVVDHFRQIHYCSEAYLGATNDHQISGDDKYPVALSRGDYENVEFELYKEDGSLVKCRGGYLICDGGMPKDACFIDPQHHHSSRPAVLFSEWLESIRKDVECTFGILKQRWRFLRNKIQYHEMDVITAAMRCCCILHNMLLVFDGIFKHTVKINEVINNT